jgi:ankyrin repeat protein
VPLLVAAGADVNAQDNIKDSPFLLAGASGDVDILKLLIAATPGPDFKRVNRYGGSALIPACERGHVDAVKLLIKAGLPVDHLNRLGWTGLLEAIIVSDGGKAHQQIVEALIGAGADVDLADRMACGRCSTPSSAAMRRSSLCWKWPARAKPSRASASRPGRACP